ncbi:MULTISPECIES: NUDIX hydrolase [Streptomyces]|jgi:ADP-ribose pyrophosphatase YjhB (NUDIX family)|uniref:NUDIX hydrolase n=1 Tax=Streptomyces TaxID=1883 RepID=UPI001164E977|nr:MULTISPECIES: NUDIX domain-containing protein [Streptomyces]MCX4615422.1 NUDIX domain-containing protein [Streptomyces mirabilis]MCX5355959.1 NUDIX domain-containing protein [Streptomyces mirabilis]QDN75922.1 NUDIX domain-containing protein [Streptomyces sp. S1A1-7]QDN84749.1 NUDIX domain-containing protein [Streptomyces sp. RLB3-6]QDO05617.1 NUDIX domain-containing protein [Streptomyces sp. S1D4-23]
MARRDYEDDPNAPAANSLVPAASTVVVDDSGRILLQRRSDNGMWALPGGAMNIGESLPDCAVRETREETGYDVEITGIVGTYTNPRHVFAYDDGEVRQEFSICFLARPVAGQLAVSEESTDVRWFLSEEVDALPMLPSIRKRVNDWRDGNMPAAR